MFEIGMLLYPGLTHLDLCGPHEVFSHVPGARVHLVWKEKGIIASDTGLKMLAEQDFKSCPQLNMIFVPGGKGQREVMEDEETLSFLRERGEKADYVTSVCTGALILGAAGLLQGYEATTHWAFLDELEAFGATPKKQRVVRDRNRATGGGVTAGIDFGLTIAAEIAGEAIAKTIQLGIEYNPMPPFAAGTPEQAGPEITEFVRRRLK